jgi:GH3 auxin-responsive promoter
VLTIATNLFEFLPESARENPNGSDLLSVDQIKQGERYYVYVTTRAGLYRYDMHDIVEVVDFYHRTPCIRFVQKGGGIVSLVGEKLTETQVELAASKALADIASKCNFVTACGQMSDGNALNPHYILVVEFSDVPTDVKVQSLADRFDATLCDVNSEYHDKRASRRLGPAVLRAAPNGFLRELRRRRHDAGIPDGQFKVMRVTIDPVFAAPFRGARDFVAKPVDGDKADNLSLLP